MEPNLRDLDWVGSSKRDMRELPDDVRQTFGHELWMVQEGKTPESAKVLKGLGGPDVLELRESDGAGTYRAVYTVRFEKMVYVLHVFQKKSKKGIATPKEDIDLIKARLKAARDRYEMRPEEKQ